MPTKLPFYPIPSLCLCGCNEIVWNGNKFKLGHWNHLNEYKKLNSKLHINKYHNQEAKDKISKANKGKLKGNRNPSTNPEVRKKISDKLKGIPKSKEHTKKNSKSHIGLQVGERNGRWKGGVSFLPYCQKFNNKKREEVRELYNRRCYICKKDEKNNIAKSGKQRKLSVHHIDMDKGQGCNGKDWKLIPLCLNCHSKIHKT